MGSTSFSCSYYRTNEQHSSFTHLSLPNWKSLPFLVSIIGQMNQRVHSPHLLILNWKRFGGQKGTSCKLSGLGLHKMTAPSRLILHKPQLAQFKSIGLLSGRTKPITIMILLEKQSTEVQITLFLQDLSSICNIHIGTNEI
jgi:hypothetical protein